MSREEFLSYLTGDNQVPSEPGYLFSYKEFGENILYWYNCIFSAVKLETTVITLTTNPTTQTFYKHENIISQVRFRGNIGSVLIIGLKKLLERDQVVSKYIHIVFETMEQVRISIDFLS